MDNAQFAERLAEARRRVGTQEAVARTLVMGVRLLQRWEAGEVRPRLDRLYAFCKETNASADYLLGLHDDPDARTPSATREAGESARTTAADARRTLGGRSRSNPSSPPRTDDEDH